MQSVDAASTNFQSSQECLDPTQYPKLNYANVNFHNSWTLPPCSPLSELQQSALSNDSQLSTTSNYTTAAGSRPIPVTLPPEDGTPSTMTLKPRRRYPLSILRDWRWELFTWLVGTVAVILIVVLTLVSKNKSLRYWKFSVQISAIIAVLSQMAQSALIVSVASCIGQAKWSYLREKRHTIEVERFDDAMRGPEGSLKLLFLALWHPRRRQLVHAHTMLAVAGTLITLMMLSFGPFTQQSVAIRTRFVTNSTLNLHGAFTYRALNYTSPDGFDKGARKLFFYDAGVSKKIIYTNIVAKIPKALWPSWILAGLEPFLSAAISSGTTNFSKFSDLTASCPTNQCQWEPYTTLAICSSVEDISTQLFSPTGMNRTLPRFWLPVPALQKEFRTKGITLRNEQFAMATLPNVSREKAGVLGPVSTIAETYVIFLPPCVAMNDSGDAYVNNRTWAMAQNNVSNWKAFKGTFSLCLRTFNTSVHYGRTNTTILAKSDKGTWYDSGTQRTRMRGNHSSNNDAHSPLVYHHDSGGQDLDKTRYGMDRRSMRKLAELLVWNYKTSKHQIFSNGLAVQGLSPIPIVKDIYGADPLERCNKGTDVALDGFRRRLCSISASLTNTLRSNQRGNDPVRGTAWFDEQFIDVDLRWLAMPLCLWFLITALLFLTIWRTSALNLPSWKASTLPLLECRDPQGPIVSRRQMKPSARATYVQLKTKGQVQYIEHMPG